MIVAKKKSAFKNSKTAVKKSPAKATTSARKAAAKKSAKASATKTSKMSGNVKKSATAKKAANVAKKKNAEKASITTPNNPKQGYRPYEEMFYNDTYNHKNVDLVYDEDFGKQMYEKKYGK